MACQLIQTEKMGQKNHQWFFEKSPSFGDIPLLKMLISIPENHRLCAGHPCKVPEPQRFHSAGKESSIHF